MDDEERRWKDNLPDEFDGQLECISVALCCSFNRCGSLLAVGCNDGRVVVWDFLNRYVAKNIPAHAGHPVSSICWSRNGHKLISASLDNSLAIWSVLSTECLIRWIFKAPLMKVQFNPRNENLVIACPFKHPPILLYIDYETRSINYKSLPPDKDDGECIMTASFDRRGQHIYTGNSRGKIMIFECLMQTDLDTPFQMISSFRIQPLGSSPAAIGEIEFAYKSKKYFLVNSLDRAIRLFSCDSALSAGIDGNCEEIRRFQDLISKTVWRRCCFSRDKDATFVCAGAERSNQLHIWSTEDGTIKKMLGNSERDILLDIQWHPTKPVVASVSSGSIFIWARAEAENWSAYAPQFKELEENKEYSEPESEFDIEDEDKERQPKRKKVRDDNIEDVEIDIMDVNLEEADYKSSDEEGHDPNALEFIPVTIEEHEFGLESQLQ